ncbi:MAG TPA: MotA/TolQ/ExbB proton channel family protein [Leptospiraceae bacterium]|nr:MotA/TolQ/ExbB proton channel family protein [Leptospirales bacterium]HMU82349.1 MotA/TolQ/ExbB proton channel family protein [Leptospiraceae bacterium]HMX55681.1 MotA/TolQ/ExbB proton channel family protein [Leptospiraceae bacterium]HMY45651.1 MotA/TolQ/ExbB proton channel family protein [Leptospiraceae bacterium]HMZ37342.1 MotA/TolQ/ExbB proton channel family protein [Leptospiraceae bacterium]
MINAVFKAFTVLGSEWVLVILLLLSVLSIAMTLERWQFYRKAQSGIVAFRSSLRTLIVEAKWKESLALVEARIAAKKGKYPDLETDMAYTLLTHTKAAGGQAVSPASMNQLAQDSLTRSRIAWDKYLTVLASIGSNTPFFGLFGTVLGIMKAFADLGTGGAAGAQGATQVSAGIAEALVATAIGLFVAIPAVVSYNTFQKRVKTAAMEADALKSFLIGSMMK